MLNAVSWGILLPVGAIFARYLKTFKSADPAWFYLHITCQIIGYGVGVGGWATGLNLGSKSKGIQYTTHRNIGISLFSLATLQVRQASQPLIHLNQNLICMIGLRDMWYCEHYFGLAKILELSFSSKVCYLTKCYYLLAKLCVSLGFRSIPQTKPGS